MVLSFLRFLFSLLRILKVCVLGTGGFTRRTKPPEGKERIRRRRTREPLMRVHIFDKLLDDDEDAEPLF